MDIAAVASLTGAVAGTAGVTALLGVTSQLSDRRRAQKSVESIAASAKLVTDDQLSTSALKLALHVASVQLAATNLVRIPLHRLLWPLFTLVAISVGLVTICTFVVALLLHLGGLEFPASPLLLWVTWGSINVAFFLAYRSLLSQHRSEFVAEVLSRERIDLEVARTYNKSLQPNGDSVLHPQPGAETPATQGAA